jgi:hypothetical protein
MASADFCILLFALALARTSASEERYRPPTVSSFTFCDMCRIYTKGLRITLWLRSPMPACLPSYALYPVSVRHLPLLPSASFRFHLTMNTLAFSYTSQLSTCVQDLHPIVKEHGWRTNKKPRHLLSGLLLKRKFTGSIYVHFHIGRKFQF